MSVKRFIITDLFKMKGQTDVARLRRMKDEEIDFSDAPPSKSENLKRGSWRRLLPELPRRQHRGRK